MSPTLKILIGLLILVATFVIGFFLVQFFFGNPWFSQSGPPAGAPKELVDAMRSGDFKGTIDKNLSIQNDPSVTPEEKALAVFSTLGAEYRLTGDVAQRIADVQKMKAIILDDKVSIETRVNVLNTLANSYSISGGDPKVGAEIFKDEPFTKYYATADGDDRTARLSSRKLLEWSYSMSPTSLAAILIARWYSEQMLFNPSLSTTTRKANLDTAEEYLKKADAASVVEAKKDSQFLDSTRYLVFRFWRTVIFGRLAGPFREEYQKNYRPAYDEFINFTEVQKNFLAYDYRLFARLYYASRLAFDKDNAAAKTQLDSLAAEMNAVPDATTSTFKVFLQNEYTYRPTGPTWKNLVEARYDLSPAFKAAVQAALNLAQ